MVKEKKYNINGTIYIQHAENEYGVFAHVVGTNKEETTQFFEHKFVKGKETPGLSLYGRQEMVIHRQSNNKSKVGTTKKYLIVAVVGVGFGFSELTAIIVKEGKITEVSIEGLEVRGEIQQLVGSYVVYETINRETRKYICSH